ncbi:UNVERIFIED_CONTAM: NADPH oxidase 4 [Gekko kuhli]
MCLDTGNIRFTQNSERSIARQRRDPCNLAFKRAADQPMFSMCFHLGLCLSRASASVLNLNCSLVLLPMCRILLAFLRGSQKVASRKTRRLLDKSKTFHVTCGVTICVFSVVHVAAHLVNALNFSVNYSEEFLALNAASFHGEDPRKLLFATVPGLTGVFMVLVLFLMSTASTYAIRVSNYDIFSYTHNLFFVFYLLLMLHVSG